MTAVVTAGPRKRATATTWIKTRLAMEMAEYGAAVADIGSIRLSGLLAWTTWLGVHIFYLIGFRNRVIVMAEWAWLYLRNERGARLITGDVEPLLKRGRRNPRQMAMSEEPQREGIRGEGNSVAP
jgi:hypothetical protein